MLYYYLMFAVLCATVCLTAGSYLLIRHPKLVERYTAWFGSLSTNHHAMFAAVFGALALMEVFDRFWFAVTVFGGAACIYAYFAVCGVKQPVVEKSESV